VLRLLQKRSGEPGYAVHRQKKAPHGGKAGRTNNDKA